MAQKNFVKLVESAAGLEVLEAAVNAAILALGSTPVGHTPATNSDVVVTLGGDTHYMRACINYRIT